MRGAKAKRLRRLVYGAEGASRQRQYFWASSSNRTIVADDKRRLYQSLKRA